MAEGEGPYKNSGAILAARLLQGLQMAAERGKVWKGGTGNTQPSGYSSRAINRLELMEGEAWGTGHISM